MASKKARESAIRAASDLVRSGSLFVTRTGATNPAPPKPQTLKDSGKDCHREARQHGFYDHEFLECEVDGKHVRLRNPSLAPEKLALLSSEISEALDALRDGDREHLAEECADIHIRLIDFCYWQGLDLDDAVEKKLAKNQQRPHMHGRRF